VNEDKAIYRYVYYWLSDKYEELKKLGQGSQSNLNAMTVRKFYIPVPPLPVQDEIVRILDQFTSLEAELEAELEARKRQYEYYRDELISFDEDIKIFSLGDIAEISVGKKPDLILETITEYEYINAGTTNSGYTNDFNCEGDTITTPSRGQGGIGFVGYQKEPFWMGPLCYRIKAKDEQNLMTRILALKKTGGVPAINRSDLVKLQIPVPEHEKQKRIVNILDNFDTLINNLVQGLPAEIEARQKQYEYYREKLLTFKEKVS
jgi:type I restriction enzyme S subunit